MTHDPESVYSTQSQALPAGSLFDTFADQVLRRVDDVIAGRDCAWAPRVTQVRLLQQLRPHQGKRRAVPLHILMRSLSMNARMVKELVQDLRQSFGVQIGASRDASGGGYYIVATEAESEETVQLMYSQAVTMLRVVHKMRRGRQTAAELTRQVELELEGA